MKSINYYIRKDNHPITAITVIEHEEKVARGIAICNECDQFEKVIGRELSKGRALKAYNKEKSFGKIRLPLDIDEKHKFKCEYMPTLTQFEVDLLAPPVDS